MTARCTPSGPRRIISRGADRVVLKRGDSLAAGHKRGGASMAANPKPKRSSGGATHPARKQPESLRLRSIMPSYTVNDIQRSLAWYQDGLGFFVAERWEDGGRLKGVTLKAGSCQLGLSQDDFAKGRDRRKGEGFRIWCDTAQDVDAIAA